MPGVREGTGKSPEAGETSEKHPGPHPMASVMLEPLGIQSESLLTFPMPFPLSSNIQEDC